MRARWVSRRPSSELPIIGQAQIASFLPWRFYFVSTIQLDNQSPLSKLTRSLELGGPIKDVPLGADEFITEVFRCNKDMIVESFNDRLFECKYSTLYEAQMGHNKTVDLLAAGKLKLEKKR